MANQEQDVITEIIPESMSIQRTVFGLILVLLALMGLRLGIHFFSIDQAAHDAAWNMTWHIGVRAAAPDARFIISLPRERASISLYGQTFEHPGLSIRRTSRLDNQRALIVSVKQPGEYHFTAAFDLFQHWESVNPIALQTILSMSERQFYLDLADYEEDLETLGKLSNAIEVDTANENEAVVRIYNFVRNHMTRKDPEESGAGFDLRLARAMLVLCRANYLPARLVAGVELTDTTNADLQYWINVWIDNQWQSFDPGDDHVFDLPASYLPIRRSGHQIIEADSNIQTSSTISIKRQAIPKGLYGHGESLMDIFDFHRLSLDDRNILSVLLVLPLGGLMTVFLRRYVGMRPYGTFAPTLLALSTARGDWLAMCIVFIVVLGFGILGRSVLPGLKLKRLPRLGIVFTLVAIGMAFSISLMRFIDYNPGETGMLLPMAVMTILVDNFYKTAEVEGQHVAFIRLMWTIIVSIIVLGLFLIESIGIFLLAFPEMHLLTVALIILIGKYSGPTLIPGKSQNADLPADTG